MDRVTNLNREFLSKRVKVIILFGVPEELIVKDFLLN